MNNEKPDTKKKHFFLLFCSSLTIHLLLPFLVFVFNPSSFDQQLFLSSYFSPLWIIIYFWLLSLIIITDYSLLLRMIFIDIFFVSWYLLMLFSSSYLSLLWIIIYFWLLLLLLLLVFKTYLKKHTPLLRLIFIGIFVVSWYLLPGVYNFIKPFVYNIAQTGNALWDHLSTQIPQIISILFWELIVFWLLSVLICVFIYVVVKRKNIFKKLQSILLDQHPIHQKLWSIVIFPFNELGTKGKAIISILAVFFVIFAFVLSSPHFPGAGTVYFAGVTAIVGLIFTWSASAAIADFISGIILIFLTNLEKGDWVEIGEITGKIQEQNLLVHQLKTSKNTIVTIPNANVLRNIITNYTPSRKRTGVDRPHLIYTTVTLGYDVNQNRAINVLKSAAKSTLDIITQKKAEKMQDKFKEELNRRALRNQDSREIEELYDKIINKEIGVEPFVLITSLDDFYVSYELNAYLNPSVSLLYPERIPKIYSKLHQHIQEKCLKAKIEILSPHYEACRNGNIPAVPEEHLGKFQLAEQDKQDKYQKN